MAHNQKVGLFSKILDLIGLTEDIREDADVNQKVDFDDQPARNRYASKNARFGDEFDEEPKMSRAQHKRSATVASAASSNENNSFDFDESWEELSSRPEYGARNQQRAQSKNRSAAGKYGSEQRGGSMGVKTNGRYDGQKENETHYRGSSSYRQNDYQQRNYHTDPSYGTAGSRRYEDPSYSAYGDSYTGEQYASGNNPSAAPRHQTVIFKLHSVNECKGVIMALIEKKSVLLNLDELDSMQAQRTLDTMSGATFAIGATLSRASDRTWLITPSTVDVKDNPVEPTGSNYGGRYTI